MGNLRFPPRPSPLPIGEREGVREKMLETNSQIEIFRNLNQRQGVRGKWRIKLERDMSVKNVGQSLSSHAVATELSTAVVNRWN
jgi:hypothetical protein